MYKSLLVLALIGFIPLQFFTSWRNAATKNQVGITPPLQLSHTYTYAIVLPPTNNTLCYIDVSRHILVIDTSVLAKSNIGRREYMYNNVFQCIFSSTVLPLCPNLGSNFMASL
jgi:hypothetical protein